MSPEPTKTQTSLAVSIRTLGQDLAAVQKGQTPTPRMETVVAGPPETLPVEQLAWSPRPLSQPTPQPPPSPKPAVPGQIESVLAPKTPLPKPLIAPAQTAPELPTPQPKLATPIPTSTVSSILKARIQADLQEATKRQDAMVTSVLRLLISAVHNAEIAKRKEITGLNDNEIRDVIASEVQRRKEAIAGYERGGRGELTEKERAELAVLYHYLPTQPKPLVTGPPAPPKPAAPLTQPVKPAFSPPPRPPYQTIPPPPAAAPKPTIPLVTPPAPPAAPMRPQPAAPKAPEAGGNRRKLVFLASSLAVVVLAAAGGALWWFKFRPTPTPPPPPPIVEPTPPTAILRAPVTQTVETPAVEGIRDAIERVWSTPGTVRTPVTVFVKLAPVGGPPKRYATADDLVRATSLTFPSTLRPAITDLNLIWYTQDEIFSVATPAAADRNRFELAIRLNTTAEATPQHLAAWESTMTQDLEPYLRLNRFGIDPMVSPFGWQDTTYRAISIRYINYTLPDQSVDYALLPEQNLLLITTSREGMYALIDRVLISNGN